MRQKFGGDPQFLTQPAASDRQIPIAANYAFDGHAFSLILSESAMTSFLLYAVLGYLGPLAILALSFGRLLECPEESTEQKWETLLHMRSPYRELTLLIGTIIIVLIAPVMVPYCLTQGYLADRRHDAFFTWLKRTHRDNVYEKIHPVKLPKSARQYFEEHTPELLDLGFCELGRYILKPEPAQSFGCCFQSPDGRTVGVLGHMFDASYYSFQHAVCKTAWCSKPRRLKRRPISPA